MGQGTLERSLTTTKQDRKIVFATSSPERVSKSTFCVLIYIESLYSTIWNLICCVALAIWYTDWANGSVLHEPDDKNI